MIHVSIQFIRTCINKSIRSDKNPRSGGQKNCKCFGFWYSGDSHILFVLNDRNVFRNLMFGMFFLSFRFYFFTTCSDCSVSLLLSQAQHDARIWLPLESCFCFLLLFFYRDNIGNLVAPSHSSSALPPASLALV